MWWSRGGRVRVVLRTSGLRIPARAGSRALPTPSSSRASDVRPHDETTPTVRSPMPAGGGGAHVPSRRRGRRPSDGSGTMSSPAGARALPQGCSGEQTIRSNRYRLQPSRILPRGAPVDDNDPRSRRRGARRPLAKSRGRHQTSKFSIANRPLPGSPESRRDDPGAAHPAPRPSTAGGWRRASTSVRRCTRSQHPTVARYPGPPGPPRSQSGPSHPTPLYRAVFVRAQDRSPYATRSPPTVS